MGDDAFAHASGDAYDRLVGRYGHALARELTGFAGVRAGMRALDVGCGPGALLGLLGERLGAGRVTGADPSASFVHECRRRHPGIEVVQASAETLPFPDAAFDAVLAQLVVNFMADPPAGVREMARVARPGGVVAACVWDYGEGMTLLRAFWDAAREVTPEAAAAADEGVVMPWCRESELGDLWRSAGLRDVRLAALDVRAGYAGFDDLWTPFTAGVAPSGAFCAALDEDARAALRAALERRLGVGDGAFELPARAWAVAGTAP